MILAAQPESPLNAGVNAYLACHGSLHTSQVARSASLPPSSGGRSFRNARYSTTSYTTFVPPPIIKGAENARFRMTRLATAEPTAQKTLRARLLSPLANARSFGNNHRRHIGLPGGNVHFDQRLTAKKQEDCPFERWRKRHRDEEETGRKMSKHHRVDESDMVSKPSRSNMRASGQDMHDEENEAKVLLGDSEAAEKPVCDQGISQKASAESV